MYLPHLLTWRHVFVVTVSFLLSFKEKWKAWRYMVLWHQWKQHEPGFRACGQNRITGFSSQPYQVSCRRLDQSCHLLSSICINVQTNTFPLPLYFFLRSGKKTPCHIGAKYCVTRWPNTTSCYDNIKYTFSSLQLFANWINFSKVQ